MRRLHIPISLPEGRRLRVLIYGRYSTEEQHPSSIEDQVNYCKELLVHLRITDADIDVITDPEMSGELVFRPGINQVRAGVAARRWDLILVEDSGRLFRHETACGELIETAVDNGIRVLAINDDVDTAEEDWEDPLHEAMRHHARSNRYTAKRIKRKLEGLWRLGAAIGLLRPGYKRRPTRPATEHQPEEGPFFDEIDPAWAPVVREAYERIARREPPWLVAAWLTGQRLPKCGNSLKPNWNDRNVLTLIQRTIYRGHDRYRFTVVKKHYRSGKHNQVRNDPDKVLTREMPHLRIVSDELWRAANQAIAERMLGVARARGQAHPLAGVPRDSRGPLSKVFFCGVCKTGKMYREGRVEGGYRCSNTPNGDCWNKATADRDVTHAHIGRALLDALLNFDGVREVILAEIPRRLVDDEPLQKKLGDLQSDEVKGLSACERLLVAIENGKDAVEVLAARLHKREADLARIRAEIDFVKAQLAARTNLPNHQEILDAVLATIQQTPRMDRETGALLQQLVGRIWALPFQQFGSNLVVLRAKFELRLVALPPAQWQALFNGTAPGPIMAPIIAQTVTVDLFKRSTGPRHFAQALEMADTGKTLDEIGQATGMTKRQAHIAVQYGRDLKAVGLSDPYVELTEPPKAASRWRFRAAD